MLRIGELARITGVTPRLLRHYEAVGVLSPAETNPRTGYRYYERAQVATLQRVLSYRDSGVPLTVIAQMLDVPHLLRERQKEELRRKRATIDRQLAALDAPASRPFRVKRTPAAWTASVRRSVESYAAAENLLNDLRDDVGVDAATPSAAVWYDCRPDEGRIDCELQVVFARPGKHLCPVPSQLVVSYAHTGPDAELPAIYREMKQWSRAARYRHCGPLREVYWSGITEVQFPVC